MQTYPMVNTQVVGQTERALGALLGPILVRAETTFEQWLVLAITAAEGGAADRERLVGRIADARKMDPADVETAIGELGDAGLLSAPAPAVVSLTDLGRARHGRISGAIAEVTARLFDFPDEELATTGRVLSIVTERANAELAAG